MNSLSHIFHIENHKLVVISFLTVSKHLAVELTPLFINYPGFDKLTIKKGTYPCMFGTAQSLGTQ